LKQHPSFNEERTSTPDRAAMPDPVFSVHGSAEGGLADFRSEDGDDIDDGEHPFFLFRVPSAADLFFFE